MLYKGKREGYYLYELTSTDLIWDNDKQQHYRAGNVLLFTSKKDVSLGAEQIKADDLTTALDYLEGAVGYTDNAQVASEESLTLLKEQLARSEEKSRRLDGLLHELTSDLDSQRYSNQMLIAQLENLREQISIERLSRNEVIGDLEVVSAETYRKEQELQAAIDDKTQLEQELAARICELLELDSANTELQKRLEERTEAMPGMLDPGLTAAAGPATQSGAVQGGSTPGTPLSVVTGHGIQEAQVLTSPTGKQIHISHEFPVSKSRAHRKGTSALYGLVRTVGLLIVGLLVFIAGSAIATARLNDLSLGEALDLTLKTLLP